MTDDELAGRVEENEICELIHRYYMRLIGQLMHQADHWAENGKPLAAHHRVMTADAYYQVAVLFDPKRRILGHPSPIEEMNRWLKLAEDWEIGTYPPSPEIHRYRNPEFVAALRSPVDEVDRLREALKAARDALHQHYIDWDGEPEDAVPLLLARSKCDKALSETQP